MTLQKCGNFNRSRYNHNPRAEVEPREVQVPGITKMETRSLHTIFLVLLVLANAEARWGDLQRCHVGIQQFSTRCQCYSAEHLHCSYRDVEECEIDHTLSMFTEIKKISVYGSLCESFLSSLERVSYDTLQVQTEACPDNIERCRFAIVTFCLLSIFFFLKLGVSLSRFFFHNFSSLVSTDNDDAEKEPIPEEEEEEDVSKPKKRRQDA